MNYSSYQAPADPAAITLPSDGGATPYQLNPTQGVQRSSAEDPNAPVTVQGIQMSAEQAREYGFTNEPEAQEASVLNEDLPEAQEEPSGALEEVTENALEEGTAEALN